MSSYGRRSTGSGHMPHRRLHFDVSSRPTLRRRMLYGIAMITSGFDASRHAEVPAASLPYARHQLADDGTVAVPRIFSGGRACTCFHRAAVAPLEEFVDGRCQRTRIL